jgi:hypothetical protein
LVTGVQQLLQVFVLLGAALAPKQQIGFIDD